MTQAVKWNFFYEISTIRLLIVVLNVYDKADIQKFIGGKKLTKQFVFFLLLLTKVYLI